MEEIATNLNAKLQEWRPATAQKVRELVGEIIGLADDDALDTFQVRIAVKTGLGHHVENGREEKR